MLPAVDFLSERTADRKRRKTMTAKTTARQRLFESLALQRTTATERELCEALEHVNAVAEHEQCRGDKGALADAINALVGFVVCGDPAAAEAGRPYAPER